MALLKWDKNYSVNIDIIDNQHRRIIHLLNRMHDAIIRQNAQPETDGILRDLIRCIKEEFYQEEELLLLTNFPYIEEHLDSHQKLAETALDLQTRHKEGENVTFDLMQFLTSWITQHIMSEDKLYEEFLSEALNPQIV